MTLFLSLPLSFASANNQKAIACYYFYENLCCFVPTKADHHNFQVASKHHLSKFVCISEPDQNKKNQPKARQTSITCLRKSWRIGKVFNVFSSFPPPFFRAKCSSNAWARCSTHIGDRNRHSDCSSPIFPTFLFSTGVSISYMIWRKGLLPGEKKNSYLRIQEKTTKYP